MMAGKPIMACTCSASSMLCAIAAARHVEADGLHGLLEQLAVLGLVDGLALGADHLHAVFFQHALAVEIERGVQRGLAAHGRQQRVRALLCDDLRDRLPGDRLDVGGVGHLRVGHDGGRIGVDQNDAVALFAQRLAGLRAGVVELAALADDDRAGADDQDAFDVGAFRHGLSQGTEDTEILSSSVPRGLR